MSEWRRVAIETVSQLKQEIEHAETPEDLWGTLSEFAGIAYIIEPRDEELLTQIFRYARWCLHTPPDKPLYDAAVGFYNSTAMDKVKRKDIPFRLSKADFQLLRDEHWEWCLDDNTLARLDKEFWETIRKRGGRDPS